MSHDELPSGWNEAPIQRLSVHVDGQTDAEAAAEDEEAIEIVLGASPKVSSLAAWDQRRRISRGGPVQPKFLIEEVEDPEEVARHDVLANRARQNDDWLQAHWPDLLPEARGKFIAVAGQEAFISDDLDEVLAMAKAAHPDDDGIQAQYVRPERGPRIYAHHR